MAIERLQMLSLNFQKTSVIKARSEQCVRAVTYRGEENIYVYVCASINLPGGSSMVI